MLRTLVNEFSILSGGIKGDVFLMITAVNQAQGGPTITHMFFTASPTMSTSVMPVMIAGGIVNQFHSSSRIKYNLLQCIFHNHSFVE